MRGAPDQVEAIRRLTKFGPSSHGTPTPMEMDMENVFWEIPLEEVTSALNFFGISYEGGSHSSGFASTSEASESWIGWSGGAQMTMCWF